MWKAPIRSCNSQFRFVGAAIVLAFVASSGVVTAPVANARICDRVPTGVETSDYNLGFRVPPNLMPDSRFTDQDASIRVHRVSPVYENGKCWGIPNLAIVMVHGRSLPGSVNFDLRHPTAADPSSGALSLQEALARRGIDTFAPDMLGYGLSTRFAEGLDDPANASLPAFGPGDVCGNAVGCDRTRNGAIFPLNQQARYLGDGLTPAIDGLGVNPLNGELRPHSSSTYFANIDVWARDVTQVVDDAIEKARPRANKVVLLGQSFGGPRVARALYKLAEQADRKVSRLVFMASLFNRLPGVPGDVNLPTDEADLPAVERSTSFPLVLGPLGGWDPVPAGREAACPGRIVDGAPAKVKQQVLDLDPLGASWGGGDDNQPTGVLRAPTFTNYGWNPTVAATFDQPTLLLHGTDDVTSPVANSDNMFAALTSVTEKVMLKVECGAHNMHLEGCELADRCDDDNPDTTPYGQTSQVWGGPHVTVASALAEWVIRGTVNRTNCGQLLVNSSGIMGENTAPCATNPMPFPGS